VKSAAARETPGSVGAIGAGVLFCLATVAAVQFLKPGDMVPTTPLRTLAAHVATPKPLVTASAAADAFGQSGNVKVRFALPGRDVEFPVNVPSANDSLLYTWVPVGDSGEVAPMRPLTAGPTIAPARPGFYHLALSHGAEHQILPEPLLAVMMPFDQKIAGRLNGYRIGTYLAERFGREDREHPPGFLEVRQADLDLQVTRHLRLAAFVTHDEQRDVWPKYVALNPKLLDKLELVFAELGGNVRAQLAVDIHSGFRTPLHNARVPRAASDSRHQYGDAADIAVDADGDGRITMTDALLVTLAVERVEDAHPELMGGLGLYTSRRYPSPYVHIDARGTRKRWKG